MKPYNHLQTNVSFRVKLIRHDSATIRSIVFERPAGFQYTPGDWVDVQFNLSGNLVVKTFSFSSSPTEPDLMITFKLGISAFKHKLALLQRGDMVNIYQIGNSGFGLNDKYDSVMIAGGIGIAPFRSMIKQAIDTNSHQVIHLIYQSKTEDFAFRNELRQWTSVLQRLTIHYVDSTIKGRLKNEAIIATVGDIHAPKYYIAGPPGMVESTENFLLNSGIALDDIADDEFRGY